jgi:hypothetical protein
MTPGGKKKEKKRKRGNSVKRGNGVVLIEEKQPFLCYRKLSL